MVIDQSRQASKQLSRPFNIADIPKICVRSFMPLLVTGEVVTVLGSPMSGTYTCKDNSREYLGGLSCLRKRKSDFRSRL